jgi:hypothetical protein
VTDQIEETGSITNVGPVPNVTVHAHMRTGPHALTTDPLDLVVVVELMFLFGEQARRRPTDESLVITPQTVLERLRELGVRSGNGSRLVGRDAVYESFARLRAKGYIRRIQLRKDNRAAGVAYEFYDFPAWNPEPPVLESPQVGATSGNAGSGNAGSRAENRTSRSSPQVGATSGNAGSGNAGSRSGVAGKSQVGATSGNAGHPPHPPEEVDTSSPYPLTRTKSGVPSPREEVAEFPLEDLQAAERLLQTLKKPWHAGRMTAQKEAPRLLAVMRDQGWPAVRELSDRDRQLLERELTKNPEGVTRYSQVLPKRIADLLLYEVVSTPGRSARAEVPDGTCLRHPAFREDDCAPCRAAERDRKQRGNSEPKPVDGAGLLARLRAGLPADE